jgi:outer membrane lipoprotein SlyB
MKSIGLGTAGVLLTMMVMGCSEPLTTRETGAVIGTVGGAAAGGIIGGAVGHPGAGAAIGGAVGLGAGALIGDQIQALQKRQSELEKQLKSSQEELDSQRKELERLKKDAKEY